MSVISNAADLAQKAKSLMGPGKFGCSEAVILTFQEVLPQYLPKESLAMSTAFRGGLAAGCLCGALASATMIIGAVWGYKGDINGPQDQEAINFCRKLAKEMHDRFKEAHQHTCCSRLTNGLPHGAPERVANCRSLVESSSLILADILQKNQAAINL